MESHDGKGSENEKPRTSSENGVRDVMHKDAVEYHGGVRAECAQVGVSVLKICLMQHEITNFPIDYIECREVLSSIIRKYAQVAQIKHGIFYNRKPQYMTITVESDLYFQYNKISILSVFDKQMLGGFFLL